MPNKMMMANVNFIVLKINDIDVAQLPQQQQQKAALNMLLNEETDHVVLKLKRKSCWNPNENIDYEDDMEIGKNLCYLKFQHNNTTLRDNKADNNSTTMDTNIIVNLHLPINTSTSTIHQYCMTKSTQTEDIAFYVHEHLRDIQRNTERLIEHEHNLFEQSLAPEIDIEEITLRKSDSNERLGITVCYSNAEDDYTEAVRSNGAAELYSDCAAVTEVYISDIHPDSVAGRDGRLRQGDQILQINGKDIKTRPETETLIAENNNAVTLLVSRYLYADEDDFNDPSTNEDEDEVLMVEDDEEDEEDEDEDDEFYDENNMTYVNCVINNDCCLNSTDQLDKALMSQIATEKVKEKLNINSSTFSLTHTNPAYQTTTLKCTPEGQKDKLAKNDKKSWLTGSKPLKTSKSTGSGIKSHKDDYETEHIYETIPEDPESEPFYCSPYDSSVYVSALTTADALQHHLQQKQRVAQWLGLKPLQDICSTTAPRQSVRSSSVTNASGGRSSAFFHKSTCDTVRSNITTLTNDSVDCLVTNIALPLANCHLEDQDNSSSAYNTGGSNNSVSPLTLMLQPKNRCDPSYKVANSTTINPPANVMTDEGLNHPQICQKSNGTQKIIHSPKDKTKITSPKRLKTGSGAVHKMPVVVDLQMPSNVSDKTSTINKENNVHRNMLLKQHLFNQKLSLEKTLQPHALQQRPPQYYYQQQHLQPADRIHCPQFTAPNLSQYHFVSSQEVNSLSFNNKIPKSSTTVAATNTNPKAVKKEDETMVWKVKRRPDGSRYIVRRPAKNRIVKERNTRTNVERLRNDLTTTEDDTISEIKTGRYWTREERKKHIEKARERRHQQQQQQQQHLFQQQQNKTHIAAYDDSTAAAANTWCMGDIASQILQDPCDRDKMKHQQHLNLLRQQQQKITQQHYQLQFNSAEDHKNVVCLNNKESPTTTIAIAASEDVVVSSLKVNLDPTEVMNTIIFPPSEHNQINNDALPSLTIT